MTYKKYKSLVRKFQFDLCFRLLLQPNFKRGHIKLNLYAFIFNTIFKAEVIEFWKRGKFYKVDYKARIHWMIISLYEDFSSMAFLAKYSGKYSSLFYALTQRFLKGISVVFLVWILKCNFKFPSCENEFLH